MILRRCAVFLELGMALLGCHPAPGAVAPLEDPPGEISIVVVNRNRIDVMVYIAHSGVRDRLGLATASTTTQFAVSLRRLGAGHEYRLLGDPLGMRMVVTTETLFGRPGDEVIWSLEDSFARSTVVVH